MEEKKQNCWEYKKCGREPGGEKTSELGVCPAAVESAADGIHGGKDGGRCCWVIAGTLCDGETQGSFAKKFVQNCQNCDFYILVKREEEGKFKLSNILLNTIELNKQNKKNNP